jgi:cytochrome c oxidase subunit II
MKKNLAFSMLLLLLLAACNLPAPGGQTPLATNAGPTAPGGQTPVATSAGAPDPKNGERIYFTSVSDRGGIITYTGGPNFGGMMMGEFLTCASCHGPDGSGGVHRMFMGEVMDAPNIRYSALNSLPDIQGKSGGYTFQDFKNAVEDGTDVDGSALEQNMPRRSMSEANLQDLFVFIETLK